MHTDILYITESRILFQTYNIKAAFRFTSAHVSLKVSASSILSIVSFAVLSFRMLLAAMHTKDLTLQDLNKCMTFTHTKHTLLPNPLSKTLARMEITASKMN
jgi:hypothetical protein